MSLLLCMTLVLAACDTNDNGTDESGSSTPTETPTEGATNEEPTSGEQNTETPTTGEQPTEAPTDNNTPPTSEKTLIHDEVMALLEATDGKLGDVTNLTQHLVMAVEVSFEGSSFSTTAENTIELDGNKVEIFVGDTMGTGEMSIIAVDGVCYFDMGENGKYKVAVTEEQLATILDEYNFSVGSVDGDESESESESDIDITELADLKGTVDEDGNVTVTSDSLSSDLFNELLAEFVEDGSEISIEDLSFSFVISSESLPSEVNVSMTINFAEEGVEYSMGMDIALSYEFGNASVSVPADADEYEEYTFEDMFGYPEFPTEEPDAEESALIGLPLDGDNYEISYTDEELCGEQYYHLYIYSPYYEGKTFTLRGSVEFISDEDFFGDFYYTDCGFTENYFYYTLEFEDGVEIPESGKEVILTATLVNLYDEDGYAYDFVMLVSNIEAVG